MGVAAQTQLSIVQHIWCSVTINKKMEDVFIGFILSQIQNKIPVSEYVVYLTTLGGSTFSALNLYNFMKTVPQKTTAYNMGTVNSAGVTFFLAFQSRLGVPDCNFMIHQTTLPRTVLPEQFNVFDIETQKTSLSTVDANTHRIIHKETKLRASKPLSEEEIREAALVSTSYGAEAAMEHGLIDKIESPRLPDAGIYYLTDQYLATLPG